MCDTMAASGVATVGGVTLFAKNSDRERNEAQYLQYLPAQDYGRGAVVRATYIAIPQVARTHAVLLSRPFWIWGAEMGANEHGVVIGNEAVHPRALPQRSKALIGMDLLRLGLERGATAAGAIEAITGLETSLVDDRPRALIQMATGAGKTFTACAFAYRAEDCAASS